MEYEVVGINIAPPALSLAYKGSILDRLLFKLSFVRDSRDINRIFREQVSIYSPVIKWIEKALPIHHKTIRWIKEFNYKNVFLFYSNDNLEKWHNAMQSGICMLPLNSIALSLPFQATQKISI